MRFVVLLLTALAAPALAQTPDRLGASVADLVPVAETRSEAAVSATSAAAAPSSFSYQGVLEDNGQPVADGTYAVQLRLFDVATGGTALYIEDHTVVTEAGVFALSVGGGSVIAGAFSSVNLSEAVWVEVAWAGTTLSPRTAIEPSPVAQTLAAGATVEGDGSWALRGVNTATSGTVDGVYGLTASTEGRAVVGIASATSGETYGGRFESASSDGQAVFGWATAATGFTIGVLGESQSTGGLGVYGFATSSSGRNYGVYGQTQSSSGRGVIGIASSDSGQSVGVEGSNASSSGTGVLGSASSASGRTYGVYGVVVSSDGYSGYFEGGRGIHVEKTDIGLRDTALENEAIVVEHEDAVVGLYSDATLTWGSALTLGEVDGDGSLTNKWTMQRNTGASGSLHFTFGTNSNYGFNNTVLRVDTDGTVHADASFTGGGADLAEYFPLAVSGSTASVRPGDLVGLRGGRVSLDTEATEQVMIASSDPAFIGNPDAEAGGALVALVGQAEVRLAGTASVGDLLVASGQDDGTARAVAPSLYDLEADGPVAGRVLSVPEAGVAVALVGVDEAAVLRGVVVRQAERIDALEARLARLEAAVGS